MSKYRIISSPYFPVFGLKTGKYGPEKAPYSNSFHAVKVLYFQIFTEILVANHDIGFRFPS